MTNRLSKILAEARAFYPEYLAAHSSRANRVLHFIGASLFYGLTITALVTLTWWLFPVAIFAGYLLPGIGHHFFEHNKSFRASKPVLCVLCASWLYTDTLLFRTGKKMAAQRG
ncbi:MAG: DUF962 domain-containing protein [Dinghuibacter sp.]|nr:DUF962 domain-containing protein [Dinghuibacter sp.]